MTAIAALLIASGVALALPGSAGLQIRGGTAGGQDANSAHAKRNRLVAAGATAAAVWLFTGAGVMAAVLAIATFVVVLRLLTRISEDPPLDEAALARQATDSAELMAACLASGATLHLTTTEVAAALDDPMAGLLHEAASLMTMGASADRAWRGLAAHEATAPISRAVIRSEVSGAPTSEALAQCALDLRDQRKATAATLVRSVTVASVGPLGLCFLPAFILLGVVPIVAGLIGGTLTGP